MSSATTGVSALHALRVCGLASTTRLADHLRARPGATEAVLRRFESEGLVRYRDGRVSGWQLTDAGRQRHDAGLGSARAEPGWQEPVTSGYALFLARNRELKEICTAWQMRTLTDGSTAINDHRDAAYDRTVIERLTGHDLQCEAMFEKLAAGLSRFSDYRQRLDQALDRLTAGDTTAFATPMSASYHCIWMELHQDLLLTLGRERDDADGH
jgi:DNA-binding MarR family transcriptional regulator